MTEIVSSALSSAARSSVTAAVKPYAAELSFDDRSSYGSFSSTKAASPVTSLVCAAVSVGVTNTSAVEPSPGGSSQDAFRCSFRSALVPEYSPAWTEAMKLSCCSFSKEASSAATLLLMRPSSKAPLAASVSCESDCSRCNVDSEIERTCSAKKVRNFIVFPLASVSSPRSFASS